MPNKNDAEVSTSAAVLTMKHVVSSTVFLAYVGFQTLLIGAFFFIPIGSWLAAFWQLAVGWIASGFVLAGARRFGGNRKSVWYLFATGLFLNTTGILIDTLQEKLFGAPRAPNLSDLFFLGLYPCLIIGMAVLVYRRGRDDESGGLGASTAVSAIITVGMGLVAWELVIAPQDVASGVTALRIAVITAYPMADLVLIALVLRLVFAGGLGNPAFGLILASIFCFLGADIGWVVPFRTGEPLGDSARHLLAATSLSAFALMGAAVCHPAFRQMAQPPGVPKRPTPALMGSLAISLLIAPAVLAVEAVLDKLYSAGP